MTTLTLEKYLLIEDEQERKDKFKEMAFFYCDGVGTELTGPIYKIVAEGIFWSVASYVGALVSGYIWKGVTAVKMKVLAAEAEYAEFCTTTAETAYLSLTRQFGLTNDFCLESATTKERFIHKLNKKTSETIVWILGIVITAMGGSVALGEKEQTKLERLKSAIYAIYSTQQTIVCKLAAVIELLATTCTRSVTGILNKNDEEYLKF